MGFLAYAALAAMTTPDRGLTLNDKAHLPIVNVDVSANGFFILAPLLVILIFLYLQLYLQRQMRLLDYLGQHYDHLEGRRLYPWIVNIAAFPDSGFMGKLQRLAIALCIWIAPVIVLNIISVSYIRHHGYSSYAVASLALVGTVGIVLFWQAYGTRRTAKKSRVTALALSLLVVVFEVLILWRVIPWADQGAYLPNPDSFQLKVAWAARTLVYVDLRYQKFVDTNMRGAKLQGADLRDADFRGANLQGAKLQGADLQYANLEGADLQYANLEAAWLRNANLQRASLLSAHLEGASFRAANLEEAHLEEAHLAQADLTGANLTAANLAGADLTGADLTGASFYMATLTKADCRGARNLTINQLGSSKTVYKLKLNGSLLREVPRKHPDWLMGPPPPPGEQSEKKPK